jgi:FHS family Na+ dependent glucose MFS transporter 1
MTQATATPAVPTRAFSRTLGYYLAFLAVGLTGASLGPTLPDLAAQTHTRLGEAGVLFTARSLGYMLGSLGGGRLYDHWRGHRLMAAALVAMAVTMAAVPAISPLWLLAAVLLALGAAEGTVDVGGNTLLVWLHRHRVGPFMNGLHFFFGVGAFLSPIAIAQVVLHSGGIAWAYRGLAVAVLPVALWLLCLPSPTGGAAAEEAAATRPNYALVALLAGLLLCYVGAEVGFGGWVYTYAVASGLAGQATAAYLTSAFWGALTVGRFVSIPIAGRCSLRTVLLADLLGSLACLALLLAFPGSPVALWLGSCGFGLAMASIFPVTISLAERHLAFTGQVAGWFLAAAGMGGMSLPWLMGQLFEPLGPRAAMAAVFAILLAALGIFAALGVHLRRPDRTACAREICGDR